MEKKYWEVNVYIVFFKEFQYEGVFILEVERV